jgi:hypothetical protein
MQHEIEFKIKNENGEVIDYEYLTIQLDGELETAESVVGDQCVGTFLVVWQFNWNKEDFTKEDNERIQKYIDENYEKLDEEYVKWYEDKFCD